MWHFTGLLFCTLFFCAAAGNQLGRVNSRNNKFSDCRGGDVLASNTDADVRFRFASLKDGTIPPWREKPKKEKREGRIVGLTRRLGSRLKNWLPSLRFCWNSNSKKESNSLERSDSFEYLTGPDYLARQASPGPAKIYNKGFLSHQADLGEPPKIYDISSFLSGLPPPSSRALTKNKKNAAIQVDEARLSANLPSVGYLRENKGSVSGRRFLSEIPTTSSNAMYQGGNKEAHLPSQGKGSRIFSSGIITTYGANANAITAALGDPSLKEEQQQRTRQVEQLFDPLELLRDDSVLHSDFLISRSDPSNNQLSPRAAQQSVAAPEVAKWPEPLGTRQKSHTFLSAA